jgi:uncharacterized protein (DUF58 family)
MNSRPIRSHFFNAVWLYLAGAFLLLGMIVQQPPITLLGASVFVMSGLSWAWTRYALNGLRYSRRLSNTRAFRGEILTVTFQLENRSWLPLAWIDIEEHVSDRIRPLNKDALPSEQVSSTAIRHATPLRWRQRVSWSVDLECQERGSHFVGPTTIRSGDPFGFFTTYMTVQRRDYFLVYPEIVSLTEIGFPPDHPFGANRVPQHLLTDPVRTIGVRDYAPDDSIRHIHWKASAKLQDLQVKVFEPTVDLQLALFLSLDTFERYWEGLDSVRAESAIVAAASLASDALRRKSLVGLNVNAVITGSDQTLRIAPGRGPRQLETILSGLARLSPMASTNFPRLLSTEARRIPSGSTIVVISCLMTDPLAAALETVIDDGHTVTLVRVGEFEIPNVRSLHVETVPARLAGMGRPVRHRYARLIHAGVSDIG